MNSVPKYTIHRIGFLLILVISMFSLPLQAREVTRIMPLGDSITYGKFSTYEEGYRGPLWTSLSTESGYGVDFVGGVVSGEGYQTNVDSTFDLNNEGHPGWKAGEIANNVHSYLTNNPADIVLLHIGTNDMKNISEANDTRIGDVVRDVETLLDNIDTHSTQTKVVLARIINYYSNYYSNYKAALSEYNRQLAAMVKNRIANGDDIELIDMENGADINYSTDMENYLHPNDLGYAKMAHLWSETLKSIIPVHQWKVDELNQPYTDAMRDADAKCAGECPVAFKGKLGSAQQFSDSIIGGLDVDDASNINWDENDSFTIELWMKSTQGDASQGDGTIADAIFLGRMNDSGTPGWYIGTSQSTGGAIFYLDNLSITGTQDITDDAWHHIACVRDAEQNRTSLYVDGVLNTEQNVSTVTLSTSSTPLTIGYLNWDAGYEYNGALDEINIYGAALSATQIQQHYNKQKQLPSLSINSIPVLFSSLGTPYVYDANSSRDPWVTFSLDNSSPDWMSIDSDSGLITGTADMVGNFDVSLQVLDETGDVTETATQNYTLKVRDTSIFPSNMMHYWKLDETTGPTYMDSYMGSDGECTDGCPVAVSGKVDGAQIFSETDAGGIDISDSKTFNWTANDSFTISFWMKSSEKGAHRSDGTYDIAVLMGRKNANPAFLWFIGTNSSNGVIRFYIGNDRSSLYGSSNVADNAWHHIACVRDTEHNQTSLYVDGVMEKSLTVTNGDMRGTNPINIGYLRNGSRLYEYNGKMDDIKVFNSALTQAEIREEFQSAKYSIEILHRTDGVEPNTNANFTLRVSPANNMSTAISGNIVYSGTATEGSDYVAGPKRFSIAPGKSETIIELTTIDDAMVEGDETIVATISNLSAGSLGTESVSAIIADNDAANTPPVANAGADKAVQVNKAITITGRGTDSDGTIVSYEWKKGNTLLSKSASFSYIPTTVGTDTLTLTVTDDDGAAGSDSMTVTVTAVPVNNPPVANAGADKRVQVNESITITGSGTDSDGAIVSYEWKKGNTVLANTATFVYTPDTVGTDTLTLTVTDDDGATGSDSMTVTVTVEPTPKVNMAPILYLLQ